jgi:hypothetical protein
MSLYLYSLDLPFTGVKLFYRELTALEHLQLSKAHFMIPQEDDYLADYGRVLQEIVLECIKNKEDFAKINLVEYVLFLIKLRIISIGDEIDLQFKSSKENEEKIKITINLQEFAQNLFKLTNSILNKEVLETEEMIITLSWPLVSSEKVFLQKQEKIILDSVLEFIDTIKIKDKELNFRLFDPKEKIILFDKVPAKIQNKIQEKVLTYVNRLSEESVFNKKVSEYLSFNFYNFSYQNILRLFFTENLKNLYMEYYLLSSKNLFISDVNNLTVAEKNTYISFIKDENESQNADSPMSEEEWLNEEREY